MDLYKEAIFAPEIYDVIDTAISIPFQYGFTFEQWTRYTHHILEKDPGNPQGTKLKIIQIIEDDLTCTLRLS